MANVERTTPLILTLPTEIRLEIYRFYAATCSCNITVHQGKLFRSIEPEEGCSPLSLLLTCRTFAMEAAGVVLAGTRFQFLIQDLYTDIDTSRKWPPPWNYIPSSQSEAELENSRYFSHLRQLQAVSLNVQPSKEDFLRCIRHLDIRVLLNDPSCRFVDKEIAVQDVRKVLRALNQQRPLKSLNITLGFLTATKDVQPCDDPRNAVMSSLMELNKIRPKSDMDIVALLPTRTDSGEPSIDELARLFDANLITSMD